MAFWHFYKMESQGQTSPTRSYMSKMSPLERLQDLLKEEMNAELPQLNEFNKGRPFLTKLGSLLMGALQSAENTPINNDLAKMIDFGFRFLINESINELRNSLLSSNALIRLNTPPRLNVEHSEENDDEIDKLRSELFTLRSEKENQSEEIGELKNRLKTSKETLSKVKSQNTAIHDQLKTKITDLQSALKHASQERDDFKNEVISIQDKYIKSLNNVQEIENKLHKQDTELSDAKYQYNLSKAKCVQLETEIEKLQQTISSLSESAHNSMTSPNSTEMKLSPTKEDSPRKYNGSENYRMAEEKLNETREAIEQANKLTSQLEEELSKDIEIGDSDLNPDNDLEKTIDELEEQKSKLLGGFNYYKQIIDTIKKYINFKGDETKLPAEIRKLVNKKQNEQNQEANKEEIEVYKSLINGLVSFMNKFINDEDVTAMPLTSSISLNKNQEILDKVRESINNCLNIQNISSETPVFETTIGSEQATDDLLTILTQNKNSKIFAIVSLISTVNGKLIDIINEKNRRVKSFMKFFPDLEIEDILDTIYSFIRDIQTSIINAKQTLISQFHRRIDETNDAKCLAMFIDEVNSVLTNMEIELRPVTGSNVDFAEIPIQARNIIDEIRHETIESNKKSEIEQNIIRLQNENGELRKNILELQAKCDKYQQDVSSKEAENRFIKREIDENKQDFERRIEKILKDEQEKYHAELQKVQNAYDRHRSELELQNKKLSSKLKESQQNMEELSIMYNEKQLLADDSSSKIKERDLSFDNVSPSKYSEHSHLIPILSQCFQVNGAWTESKIQKAVATLIARVQRLEKERSMGVKTPRK